MMCLHDWAFTMGCIQFGVVKFYSVSKQRLASSACYLFRSS